MVILDEIRMLNKLPLLNVIGGSATFVTLGLRLFATESLVPGCLVLAGSDFPREIREEMQSWRCNPLTVIDFPDQPCSRGLLVYKDDTFGPKTFEYTTPPLRATPKHLVGTPLLSARAFHFFGRPEEIIDQVPELLSYRQSAYPELPHPFLVWEPLPSSCRPENLPAFQRACELVAVFSPNHLELAALVPDHATHVANPESLSALISLGSSFLASLSIANRLQPTLILRAGALGALAFQPNSPEPPIHVPAFHPPGSGKVVDVTGAGNAFLGGYVAGWLLEGEVRGALEAGSVAAGVAVEQIGIPRLSEGEGVQRLGQLRGRVKE